MSDIAVAVVFTEDLLRLHILTLGDQPTGAFGAEPTEGALEEGWECLKKRGNAPGPAAAGDPEGAESGPLIETSGTNRVSDRRRSTYSRDDTADIPIRIVHGGDGPTLSRVSEFSDKKGSGVDGDAETEAN